MSGRIPAQATQRIVCTLAICMLPATAIGLTLKAEDLGRAAIVVDKDANETVSFAARDFQDHLLRITGTNVPIGRQPSTAVAFHFAGNQASENLLAQVGEQHRRDGAFRISIDDHGVEVIGGSGAGTANGVYEILDRLGCRWYFPGPVGTYVPSRKEIHLENGSAVIVPSFAARQGINGGPTAWPVPADFSSRQRVWAMRNRGGGWLWAGSGHSYMFLIPENQYFKEHPEYFALLNGKRTGPNLCTANPEVVRVTAEHAIQWEDTGHPPVICVSPPDGDSFWCQCELCKARYPAGETNITDRITDFATEVGKIVAKKYPDIWMAHYIYADYADVPKKFHPGPNVMGWFTLWGSTGYSNHTPLSDDANRQARTLFERCAETYPAMAIYAYYGHFDWFTSWPMWRHISKDTPYWAAHKVKVFYSETHTNWGTQWWNFYLMYRFGWNKDENLDRVRDGFYRDFCGDAGPAMRAYDDLIDKAFAAMGSISGNNGEDYMRYTPEVIAEARKHIAEAKAAAAQQGSPFAERIDWLAKGFTINDLWCSAHHRLQAFAARRDPADKAAGLADLEELVRFLKAPGNEGLVETANLNFVGTVTDTLNKFKGGTRFGRGDFSYRDVFEGGGRSLAHAERVEGFIPGAFGWKLAPGKQGLIEWELQADGGGFSAVKGVVHGPQKDWPWRMEVSADGGKTAVQLPGGPKSTADESGGIPFDLSEAAKGRDRVRVRIIVTNPLPKTAIMLDWIEFKGKIE